jgi:hypothetical protein
MRARQLIDLVNATNDPFKKNSCLQTHAFLIAQQAQINNAAEETAAGEGARG